MKCYEEYCGYQNCDHDCCYPHINEDSIICPDTHLLIIKVEEEK